MSYLEFNLGFLCQFSQKSKGENSKMAKLIYTTSFCFKYSTNVKDFRGESTAGCVCCYHGDFHFECSSFDSQGNINVMI